MRAEQTYRVTHTEGSLRVLRDVIVRRGVKNEFVAINGEPAAAGEVGRSAVPRDVRAAQHD
jgi:hypothetical protein